MSSDELVVPSSLIKRIARGELSPSRAKDECHAFRPQGAGKIRRGIKTFIARAKEHRDRGQFGQMCGTLVVGVCVFGTDLIARLDSERVLVLASPDYRFASALGELSTRLLATPDPLFDRLRERVDTYRELHRLRAAALESFPVADTVLRQRPFKYGKTLFAIVNLAFLRHYFDFKGGVEYEPVLRDFSTPEEVADAVSTIVALANEHRPLESMDITFPMAGLDVQPEFIQLLNYGRVVSKLAEVQKLIGSIGYSLVNVRSGRTSVFCLRPPTDEVEYALRLGFVRGEIGGSSSQLHVARGDDRALFSILTAVESMVASFADKMVEIKDAETPYRRLRLLLPLLPSIFEQLGQFKFYEDVLMEERLTQELELPMRFADGEAWTLVEHLDLQTFHRAWRVLRFLNVLDIALLKRHQDDATLLSNSLIRVASHEKHVELLTAFGLGTEQVRAFLDLMYLDVRSPGHVDVQYRPFLVVNESTMQIGDEVKTTRREVVHASSLVAVANIIPNVQRSHQIRFATNAEAFVTIAAENLRSLVPKIRTNAPVKQGTQRTDVDIVALAAETLYLFECKHSVTPTGAHEMRDLWGDIQKGVAQLEVACEILRERLVDYLAGWFPGTDRAVASHVRLKPCVLCSHRVFSGLAIRGVPVRDHASLSLTLGDATVHMGMRNENNEVRLMRYRLRTSDQPTLEDLDNYLSTDATFFRMFRPHMQPYSHLDRLDDSVVLARNTFVYQVSQEAWQARLDEIGAQRLADETVTVGPTQPPKG